jgi:hypothetical protein
MQVFSLSVWEIGTLLTLGPTDSCEFFHDPFKGRRLVSFNVSDCLSSSPMVLVSLPLLLFSSEVSRKDTTNADHHVMHLVILLVSSRKYYFLVLSVQWYKKAVISSSNFFHSICDNLVWGPIVVAYQLHLFHLMFIKEWRLGKAFLPLLLLQLAKAGDLFQLYFYVNTNNLSS